MKLPRNAKIFRGQLDAAPFVSVFFLLALFLLLNTRLVFTPGVRINLPELTENLPGTRSPTVVIAVDRNGQVYFENQITPREKLLERLQQRVAQASEPLTLEIQADGAANLESLNPILLIARQAGITEALIAGRPPLRPRSGNEPP